jgi:lycopene cyclase domain-containing protein
METYLVLNIFMLTLIVLALRRPRFRRAQLITLAIIFAMTIIGDSVIIGLGIVGYDSSKILGVFLALAPIEDFFYPIAAAILIPTLWEMLGKSDA